MYMPFVSFIMNDFNSSWDLKTIVIMGTFVSILVEAT